MSEPILACNIMVQMVVNFRLHLMWYVFVDLYEYTQTVLSEMDEYSFRLHCIL